MKKIISGLLIMILLLSLTACGSEESDKKNGTKRGGSKEIAAQELTAGSATETPEVTIPGPDFSEGYNAFAVKLFLQCYQKGQNVLLSPYSVYAAVSMLNNGASGETKRQIEQMFGCSADISNNAVAYLMQYGDKKDIVKTANSIWLNENLKMEVKDAFLKTCGNYYRSAVMRAPFSEAGTLEAINKWADENTKHRISKVLDSLTDDQAMVLINAMTFDGIWQDPFYEEDTQMKPFYHANGTEEDVNMMLGDAERYFENDIMTGMDKKYENGYSFRAILPKEGYTLEDVIAAFDFAKVPYKPSSGITVSMPKFEDRSEVGLKNMLNNLGMQDAFTSLADFSAITEDQKLIVSAVIHKTFIKVDEKGTEAAAVTAITLEAACVMEPEPYYYVNLDHPFIYMIMDDYNNVPLFIGVYQ